MRFFAVRFFNFNLLKDYYGRCTNFRKCTYWKCLSDTGEKAFNRFFDKDLLNHVTYLYIFSCTCSYNCAYRVGTGYVCTYRIQHSCYARCRFQVLAGAVRVCGAVRRNWCSPLLYTTRSKTRPGLNQRG